MNVNFKHLSSKSSFKAASLRGRKYRTWRGKKTVEENRRTDYLELIRLVCFWFRIKADPRTVKNTSSSKKSLIDLYSRVFVLFQENQRSQQSHWVIETTKGSGGTARLSISVCASHPAILGLNLTAGKTNPMKIRRASKCRFCALSTAPKRD